MLWRRRFLLWDLRGLAVSAVAAVDGSLIFLLVVFVLLLLCLIL